MLRRIGHLTVASHGEFFRRDPQLPDLSVADHVEGLRAQKGDPHEDAQVLRLSQEDVTAEAGELLDLTLA